MHAQAPPAKPFLRHLMAILTASWPEEKIFLLHQSIFSHVCISVFIIPTVFFFAVLLAKSTAKIKTVGGYKNNKLSEQGSINHTGYTDDVRCSRRHQW